MRLKTQMTLLAAFLLMAACAHGQDVHYNYDRSANFAAYKTYQWVDIPGGAVPDQLIDQDIKRAADEQLHKKVSAGSITTLTFISVISFYSTSKRASAYRKWAALALDGTRGVALVTCGAKLQPFLSGYC